MPDVGTQSPDAQPPDGRGSGIPPTNAWGCFTALSFALFHFLGARFPWIVLLVFGLVGRDSLVEAIVGLISPSWSLYWAIVATFAFLCALAACYLTYRSGRRRIDELAAQKAELQKRLLGDSRISSDELA